jgi:hypothetical protein
MLQPVHHGKLPFLYLPSTECTPTPVQGQTKPETEITDLFFGLDNRLLLPRQEPRICRTDRRRDQHATLFLLFRLSRTTVNRKD